MPLPEALGPTRAQPVAVHPRPRLPPDPRTSTTRRTRPHASAPPGRRPRVRPTTPSRRRAPGAGLPARPTLPPRPGPSTDLRPPWSRAHHAAVSTVSWRGASPLSGGGLGEPGRRWFGQREDVGGVQGVEVVVGKQFGPPHLTVAGAAEPSGRSSSTITQSWHRGDVLPAGPGGRRLRHRTRVLLIADERRSIADLDERDRLEAKKGKS